MGGRVILTAWSIRPPSGAVRMRWRSWSALPSCRSPCTPTSLVPASPATFP